jgi:hypothetical protein
MGISGGVSVKAAYDLMHARRQTCSCASQLALPFVAMRHWLWAALHEDTQALPWATAGVDVAVKVANAVKLNVAAKPIATKATADTDNQRRQTEDKRCISISGADEPNQQFPNGLEPRHGTRSTARAPQQLQQDRLRHHSVNAGRMNAI